MKEIKKSASFTSKQRGKDVKFNIDLNYSPEYDSFIIKVKEGEGFMAYSSNIERMPLEVIQKLNEMLEEVLIKAGSKTEMMEDLEVELGAEPNPNHSLRSHEGSVKIKTHKVKVKSLSEAQNKVRGFIEENDLGAGNFIGGDLFSHGKKIGRVSYNGRVWNLKDEPMKMANGGKVDSKLTENEVEKIAKETANALGSEFSVTEGTIDNGSFDLDYDGVKYDGGSYIVLENGDVKNVAMPEKPIVYNYKTKKKFEFGGDLQNIASTYGKMLNDLSKEKQFNKKMEKNGIINRYAKQHDITIDNNNIIYIKGERIAYIDKINQKTGQSKSNWEIKKFEFGGDFQSGVYNRGGSIKNERLHVNKDEDYEVRYSKPRPHRKGYKGLRNFEGGGSVGYEQNLKRRLKFINEDAERIFKNAPKGFLEYPVKDWEDLGTLLSNIEIASNLKDNESDDWKSIKFSGLNSTEKLERRLKFINEDAERIFKNAPKRFLEHLVKDWDSLGTLLSNIEIASNLKDNESDNWKFDDGGVMDLTDDKRLRVRKPVMPERKLSKKEWAEKHNPRAYEFMGKDKMATGGGVEIINEGDKVTYKGNSYMVSKIVSKNIRGLYDVQYHLHPLKRNVESVVVDNSKFIKKLANGGGVGLIGNQKRIDMNHNGKIDAEDFKLLRSSMNGAWRNERKHVNHNEDYEVRYARKKPARTGYKGIRKMANGGGVFKKDSVYFKPIILESEHPNFLTIIVKYPVGDGFLTALGQKTKSGQERDNGKIKANQISKSIVNKLNKEFNIEDIDVSDNKNGKVVIFAVSNDFISLPKNTIEQKLKTNNYATGGGVSKFEKLSNRVARNYEGKRVKPQYQKEYGKVYSKSEAKEVGDKVAGKVKAMQKAESGTATKKGGKGGIMVLAKQIRKEGESWKDALKRAGEQLKN